MEEDNVFHGVGKDEMVITIAEYEEMKKELENLREKATVSERIRHDLYNEITELKLNVEKLEQENYLLKNGIANFVKGMGGYYGQTR